MASLVALASSRKRSSLVRNAFTRLPDVGDVAKVHRQALRRGERPRIEPDAQRRVERLELDHDVVPHRPLVLLLGHGAARFGEFRPDVLSEQLRPWKREHPLGLAD